MQVIADPQVPPDSFFFFIGLRAPAGGAGSNGDAERVGVVVLKQTVLSDGTVNRSNKILAKDMPHLGEPIDGPFKYESDLVPTKPELDIVVVRTKAEETFDYGARVDRGAGFGATQVRKYGWQKRVSAPRVDLAGKTGAYTPSGDKLPHDFHNAFFNGRPMVGEAPLQAGHVVQFIAVSPPAGPSGQVRVPDAPTLSFKLNGKEISPGVTMEMGVDTVVFDAASNTFLVSWRAVFPWDSRLEPATLGIS